MCRLLVSNDCHSGDCEDDERLRMKMSGGDCDGGGEVEEDGDDAVYRLKGLQYQTSRDSCKR